MSSARLVSKQDRIETYLEEAVEQAEADQKGEAYLVLGRLAADDYARIVNRLESEEFKLQESIMKKR